MLLSKSFDAESRLDVSCRDFVGIQWSFYGARELQRDAYFAVRKR
jgi:hypothetical protein